ncbi:hypothetical protein ES705_43432 [subsurface metagenome]
MNPRIGVVYFTVIAFSFNLTGQSGSSEPVVYPGGISLKYGWGAYALRDNYISPERYEGVLPFYAIGWTRTHDRYVYKLNFTLRQADDIKNFNVSTNIISFKLSQGFLYPLKPLNLFDKDLSLWLGPTTDVFYFENSPDIAVPVFRPLTSTATAIKLFPSAPRPRFPEVFPPTRTSSTSTVPRNLLLLLDTINRLNLCSQVQAV